MLHKPITDPSCAMYGRVAREWLIVGYNVVRRKIPLES